MTVRRVVALAQALTMTLLLVPGPALGGPSVARAAIVPAEPEASAVLDATGRGIGCQVGRGRYQGPKEPKDPPWPPGTRPAPTPEPSAAASDAPDPSLEPVAASGTAFLAAAPILVAQADPAAEDPEPTPLVDDPDAGIDPDVTPAPTRGRFLTGIDVSHHNGDIDYAKVRKAGHRFVFIKATQDNDFVDPMFPTNLARARAAGLSAGAYHFFDYTLDGTAQADHFLDRIEALGGVDGALPPVVDVECWAPIGSSIHAVSATRLRDFVERVYERTGRLPIVYTSVHMWNEVVGNADGFEDLRLWAACWGCDDPPSLAPGWDDWAFWQTGLSRIPGVGRLDGNNFRGNRRALTALELRPLTLDGGAGATGRTTVPLDLGGRDATHLRTSPDGETWSAWSRIRSAPEVELEGAEGEHEVFVQLRVAPSVRSPIYRAAIWLDLTGPQLSPPAAELRVGPMSLGEGEAPARVPVLVRWQAVDEHAGLADAVVSVACGDGRPSRTDAPGIAAAGELAAWTGEAALEAGIDCAITAIAADGVGNDSRATTEGAMARFIPAEREDGAAISTTVAEPQVGVVARRGPDAGRVAIVIDGTPVGLVELYEPESGEPEVVFVADLEPGREHVISVEPTDPGDPTSAGSAAAIDGFVTLSTGGA